MHSAAYFAECYSIVNKSVPGQGTYQFMKEPQRLSRLQWLHTLCCFQWSVTAESLAFEIQLSEHEDCSSRLYHWCCSFTYPDGWSLHVAKQACAPPLHRAFKVVCDKDEHHTVIWFCIIRPLSKKEDVCTDFHIYGSPNGLPVSLSGWWREQLHWIFCQIKTVTTQVLPILLYRPETWLPLE